MSARLLNSIMPMGKVDLYDGNGAYQIADKVDRLGVTGIYQVRLFDRSSGRCLQRTFSDAEGNYVFNRIEYRYRGYFVIAYDHNDNPQNAAIADLVTPEPMP